MRIEPTKIYVDTVPQMCKACGYVSKLCGKHNGKSLSRHCLALKEVPEISLKNYHCATPFWCPLEKMEAKREN